MDQKIVELAALKDDELESYAARLATAIEEGRAALLLVRREQDARHLGAKTATVVASMTEHERELMRAELAKPPAQTLEPEGVAAPGAPGIVGG